ncbi:MAG: type II secretion system F family protein [Gaiellales bacterium]
MQSLVLILIPLSIAATVLAVARGLRLTRSGTVSAIGTVSRYGYDAPAVAAYEADRKEQSLRLERAMAVVARRLSPADYELQLRRRLLQAGMYRTRASRFLMLRLLSAAGFGAIGLLYASGSGQPLMRIGVAVAAPAVGWMLPDTMLSMRIKKRMHRIEVTAADMIDLLAITVQAGLSLDQAMKVAGERLEGPLAEEVRLMLNEIRVGQDRQEALKRLADRADTPTIRAFARAMAQSESMGVSIGTTLKSLALDARARKKAVAEEAAQKAPIKMVFPLAVCFFPAILIIAAGPGIIQLVRVLGNHAQ